ncbi:anthrone oxygenase family protein [Marinilactibacillus psychrotolerans]|nr:anthrone oxygenase family protein [Marinilactibacillus psychrotolerans]
MSVVIKGLLVFSLIGTGLIAGIFFSFSNFIMTAFSKISYSKGLAAMQAINRAVLNPLLFLFFIGTAISTFLLVVLYFFTTLVSSLELAGSILYFFGCFIVTGIRNVPLNNQIGSISSIEIGNEPVWRDYLKTWTFWNHIRTFASLSAFICLIISFGY